MLELIDRFFNWIRHLTKVSSSAPGDTKRSEGSNEKSTEGQGQETSPDPEHSQLSSTNENEGQDNASTKTGDETVFDNGQMGKAGATDQANETENGDSNADSNEPAGETSHSNREDFSNSAANGNNNQDKCLAQTETKTDVDATSQSGQAQCNKGIDSANSEENETSREKSSESGPQDMPTGHEQSEDATRNGHDKQKCSPTDTTPSRKSKPPREIDGRRKRSTPTEHTNNGTETTRSFARRPELICRWMPELLRWEIILCAPPECNIAEVRLNDAILPAENGEYRLPNVTGHLSVQYDNVEEKDFFPLFNDGRPLIFKLRRDWQGEGRKMNAITQGHFVVIAPREWNQTGHVARKPDDCTDSQYKAHFFSSIKDDITNGVAGFEEYNITLTQSRFTLSGDKIFDDSEEGELFVGNPPVLKRESDIVWARVGEEKSGGWGQNFEPEVETLGDVMDGRQGRFFLRVYDSETMVDSAEFRYYAALHEIRINGEPYVCDMLLPPSSDGHASSTLQFTTADGATIPPVLQKNNPYVTLVKDGTVTIAPDPEGDEIACSLGTKTSSVDTVIKLPRIWWSLKQPDDGLSSWIDKPLVMTRDRFREFSHRGSMMLLRLPPCIRTVQVGFGDNLNQKFRVEDGTPLEIPLEAFVEYKEIEDSLAEDVPFRVQCDENTVLTLLRVTTKTISKKSDRLAQNTLSAWVKCAGTSWRLGKGFSFGELCKAGLTLTDIARLEIRYDGRRRTEHEININTLKKENDSARVTRNRWVDG